MDLCCEIKWKHQSLPKYTFCYTIQYCCRPAVLNGSKVRDIFIFDILSVSWKYLASHVCHFHKLGGGCCTIDCLKTVWGYDVCAKLPLPWIGLQLWWITTVVACFSVHEGICWCRTVTWRTIYLPPTHTHTSGKEGHSYFPHRRLAHLCLHCSPYTPITIATHFLILSDYVGVFQSFLLCVMCRNKTMLV